MAKDSPRTTARELQKIVESRGQKTFKTNGQQMVKQMVKQHYHHMLFVRVSRKIRHDWNVKWDWLLWSEEPKKIAF